MKNLNEPAIIVGYRFLILCVCGFGPEWEHFVHKKQILIVLREKCTKFQM